MCTPRVCSIHRLSYTSPLLCAIQVLWPPLCSIQIKETGVKRYGHALHLEVHIAPNTVDHGRAVEKVSASKNKHSVQTHLAPSRAAPTATVIANPILSAPPPGTGHTMSFALPDLAALESLQLPGYRSLPAAKTSSVNAPTFAPTGRASRRPPKIEEIDGWLTKVAPKHAVDRKQKQKKQKANAQPVPEGEKAKYEKVFKLYDRSGDGRMDVGELSNAMQALGEATSDHHLATLAKTFDQDKSGFLECPEFIELMSVQGAWREHLDAKRGARYWSNARTLQRTWKDPHNPELARQNDLVQWFLDQLTEAGLEYQVVAEVFSVFDVNSSGSLSPDEFEQGIKSLLGVQMDPSDLHVLNQAFDDSGDGEIDHEEFVRRLECLSAHSTAGEISP